MPSCDGGGGFSEGDFAIWVQFAGTWKRLAEISNGPRRSEYLETARACLLRAEAVRHILSQGDPSGSEPSQILSLSGPPLRPKGFQVSNKNSGSTRNG